MHRCGSCGKEFSSEEDYNLHRCETTGYVANTLEYQDALSGGAASRIAVAAQERGAEAG